MNKCIKCGKEMYYQIIMGTRFKICQGCGYFYEVDNNKNMECPICKNSHSGYCYTCGVHIRP